MADATKGMSVKTLVESPGLTSIQRSKAIQDLDRACQDGGVFRLVNHGVPEKSMKAEFHFPNKPKGFSAKTMSLGKVFLVLALILMMVSSCFATNSRKMMFDGNGKEMQQLVENGKEKFLNFETAVEKKKGTEKNYHPTSDTPRGDLDPHH